MIHTCEHSTAAKTAAIVVNTHRTDEGQVQDRTKNWYSSDEANNNWEEAPAHKPRTRDGVRRDKANSE